MIFPRKSGKELSYVGNLRFFRVNTAWKAWKEESASVADSLGKKLSYEISCGSLVAICLCSLSGICALFKGHGIKSVEGRERQRD